MRGFDRTERVAQTLRRELAHVLSSGTGDARLELLSISHVKVSRDLGYADVYVVSLKARDEAERNELVRALASAAGFLRSSISTRLSLQKTPFLRFQYDPLPEFGPKLEALIESVAPVADRDADPDVGSHAQDHPGIRDVL